MALTLEEVKKHIPETLTPEIKQFATEVVFRRCQYIFTERLGKQKYGYCTYCHHGFEADGLKHNDFATCPFCRTGCEVKASGLGRKYLFNEAYFTYYLKSAIDPRAIVAVGTYAVQDFSGDYRRAEIQYAAKTLYVFIPREGGSAYRRTAWYRMYVEPPHRIEAFDDYLRLKTVKNQFNRDHNNSIYTCYSRESITAAVAGTPFEYSGWEKYDVGDMTEFFELCAKYPCVEYLTKQGFKHLVQHKLEGQRTYGALNWNGSSMQKVFRLNGKQLDEVKKASHGILYSSLRLLQLSQKDGSNLTLDRIAMIEKDLGLYLNDLIKLSRYASIRQIHTYLCKQRIKCKDNKKKSQFYSVDQAFIAWRDYISDCIKLDYDLTRDGVIFPGHLYNAHQRTIKLVKHKADELLNKKIKGRVEKIKHLWFEQDGLLIRPAESTEELIKEGKMLQHCVGSYAERYAAGQGDILLLRQVAKPNKPYCTVEIHQGNIIQCRGYKNRGPNNKECSFLQAFKTQRLAKPTQKSKERQEVAI